MSALHHALLLALFGVGLFLTSPSGSFGQSGETELEPPRILVVDTQRVIDVSQASQSVEEQLEQHRERFQAELADERDRLRLDEQALIRARDELDEEAFAERRRAYEAQLRDIQFRAQIRRQALDEALDRSTALLRNRMRQVVAEIASARGANIVLSRRQVFLSQNSLDITDDVVARLDELLPTIPIEITPTDAAE